MELRTLRYFLTTAQEGNITRAADILHMTQPTLSRQLMELEKELGATLFVRGRRELSLTEDGLLFRQRAEELVALADKTQREFAGRHDAVSLEPVETTKYDFLRLKAKETWGHKDDPLSEKDHVTARELWDRPLFLPKRPNARSEVLNWLERDENQLNILVSYDLLSNVALLVEEGMGCAICLDGALSIRHSPELRFVPLTPEHTTRSVLIWKKSHLFNPATSLFLQMIHRRRGEPT